MVIHTLRDTNPLLKKVLKKDAVQNKDRMDVDCILHLSKDSVLQIIRSVSRIVHIIIPDRHNINDTNKVGMYPHPIDVCLGAPGKLYVLDYNPIDEMSRLLEVRLHVPADITVVSKNLADARSLSFVGNIVYACHYNAYISV